MNADLGLRIDLFAALMVRLDDPFCERTRVLDDAGLDNASYVSLAASWRARFEGDASGSLAAKFADAYAEQRARRAEMRDHEPSAIAAAREATPEQPPRGLEPLAKPAAAQPPPEQAPFVAPAPETSGIIRAPEHLAGTADISAFVPRPAVPFTPAPSAPAATEGPATPLRPHIDSGTADISASVPRHLLPFGDSPAPAAPLPTFSRPPKHLTETADISAFVPSLATPFAPAPPPPPAVPPAEEPARRRLIRFDPQTGQPLPVPVWAEMPPEPAGKK